MRCALGVAGAHITFTDSYPTELAKPLRQCAQRSPISAYWEHPGRQKTPV